MTRTLTPLSLVLFLTLAAGQVRADGTVVQISETLITDLGDSHLDRFGRSSWDIGYNDPFRHRGRHFGRRSIDPFALERALEDAARTRLARIRSAAERRCGVFLGGNAGSSQLDTFGWRIRAVTPIQAVVLLPDATAARDARDLNGTCVVQNARLSLALTGERGTARVPLVLEELHRVVDDAKDEQKTVLGALLRSAWRQAGGNGSANGNKVKIVVADAAGNDLVQADGPGLNSTIGRRAFLARLFGKKPKQLPELDDRTAASLTQAFCQAEALARRGSPNDLRVQVALRRGPISGLPTRVQGGLTQELGELDGEVIDLTDR